MIIAGGALLVWAYRVRAPSGISPSHNETVPGADAPDRTEGVAQE